MEAIIIIMIIGVCTLALVGVVYIARAILKNTGCMFGVAAMILAYMANSAASANKGYWIGAAICLIVAVASLLRRRGKKKSKKAKVKREEIVYRDLASFADAVESGDASIDANIKAVFGDIAYDLSSIADDVDDEDIFNAILSKSAALRRIGNAKASGPKKPVVDDLSELADLLEDRRATLDSTTRAVLLDVYDFCEALAEKIDDDGICDNIQSLTYDLERAIYPDRPRF